MITLDYSQRSVVALCSCGWREVTTSRQSALTAAAVHCDHSHNAQREAEKLRERHARITARKSGGT